MIKKIFLTLCMLLAAMLCTACVPEQKEQKNGVSHFELAQEIVVNYPEEISGATFMENEIAVVGDDTVDYFSKWPSGKKIKFPIKVSDAESIDSVVDEFGSQRYLVISEGAATLIDSTGVTYQFNESFSEVCHRGIEGVTVKKENERWRVAVVWEGGYYSDKRNCVIKNNAPVVATLTWEFGKGIKGEPKYTPLNVPVINSNESFRAKDISWFEDGWIVLLASTGNTGDKPYNHTWVVKFNTEGEYMKTLIKMENDFMDIWKSHAWEALDWQAETQQMVIGYDSKKPNQKLFILKAVK